MSSTNATLNENSTPGYLFLEIIPRDYRPSLCIVSRAYTSNDKKRKESEKREKRGDKEEGKNKVLQNIFLSIFFETKRETVNGLIISMKISKMGKKQDRMFQKEWYKGTNWVSRT